MMYREGRTALHLYASGAMSFETAMANINGASMAEWEEMRGAYIGPYIQQPRLKSRPRIDRHDCDRPEADKWVLSSPSRAFDVSCLWCGWERP